MSSNAEISDRGSRVLVGNYAPQPISLVRGEGCWLFDAESLIGSSVVLALTRELGPAMTGLMVTARAGSAMTTEIGTMRVTEQIDALYTMAVSPVQYLVMPRVVASVIMVMLASAVSPWAPCSVAA